MKNKYGASMAIWLTSALLVMSACNKSVQNNLGAESSADTSFVKNKVLFIMIDGAVGEEVRKAQAPTLVNMADNAIYSWAALSDYENNANGNYLAWANLLTGTVAQKHGVTGNTFAGNKFNSYPTIFTRLKQQKPSLKTAAYCATPEVADNLATDATVKQSFGRNDEAVKDAVKADLASSSTSDLIFAQFQSVDAAGAAASYSLSSPGYSSAILQLDTYIAEMITAMQARPIYAQEDWLIIVASNKGSNTGIPAGGKWSAFDDARHNTFIFFYNPKFVSAAAARPGSILPYTGNSYNFKTGNSTVATRSTTATLPYSNTAFSANKEFTIQCKIKVPKSTNATYGYISNGFLGFRNPSTNAANGVTFSISGNRPLVMLRNAAGTGDVSSLLGPTEVADNSWHTLTFVKRSTTSGGFSGSFYMDGTNIGNIASITAAFNTAFPFCAGMLTHSAFNPIANANYGTQASDSWGTALLQITDIRIYDAGLTETYIANNFCATDVSDSDPYYNNLLGFWKGTDLQKQAGTSKFYFEDFSPVNENNFYLLDATADQNMQNFEDLTAKVCPPVSVATYLSVPNSVDVAMQLYQWLGIVAPSQWGLDGKVWIPKYINVR